MALHGAGATSDQAACTPRWATAIAAALFVGGLLTGIGAGEAAVSRARGPFGRLATVAEVLGTIERDYYEEVPAEALVEGAVRGMVAALDPQSRWLTAQQVRALRDESEGATTGLGIEVAKGPGALQIVRVAPESPAEREGLAEGDQILAVDGEAVEDLDAAQLRDRLSGSPGQTTALTVLRPGWTAPQTVTTAHDRVPRSTVTGAIVADRIAYVRIALFQEGTADELLAAVRHLAEPLGGVERLHGLVLDVRDNPGGLLTEAIATTDLFLDVGTIVTTRVRGAPEEVYVATPGGLPADLAVAVIVNQRSASASEILAGALQDTGRGLIVGEPTFGKGTVQQVYVRAGAEDQAALKLTVGQYFTPSGAPVAPREGRTPDRLVPYPRPASGIDRLRAKLDALPDGPDRAELLALVDEIERDRRPARPEIAWEAPVAERAAEDSQIQAALAALLADPAGPR